MTKISSKAPYRREDYHFSDRQTLPGQLVTEAPPESWLSIMANLVGSVALVALLWWLGSLAIPYLATWHVTLK